MNAKLYGALFGLALGLVTPAKADYVVKDGNGVLQTIKSGTLSGGILPWSNLVDATGIALGTAANPLAMTFGTGVLLPQFASPAHFNCGTGCSSTGGTFNNNADGVATSTTNGQSAAWLYGWNGTTWDRVRTDVTNGVWANIKSSVLPTGAATSANQSTEITSLATLHTDLGTLNTTAGSPIAAGTALIGKVGIDQTTPGTTNGVQVNAALPAGTNLIGKAGIDQTTPGTTNNVSISYGSTALVAGPCQSAVKSFLPITLTTSAVKVIATGVSAKKIYICQLVLSSGAADNVAIFEATTGSTCATSPIAVYGAGTTVATAANGFQFAANGGISIGNGGHQVGQTTVSNNDLCIGTSAATPLTGGITYVTQ